MGKKIESIAKARAEARPDMLDALSPFSALACEGELRAVAVVGITQNGEARFSHSQFDRETDALALVGLLEALKREILEG